MKINTLIGVIVIVSIVFLIRKQIEDYEMQTDPVLDVLRRILKPVHPVMNKISLYKADKSYTINKEKVFICLKDEKGNYYPLNMLVYVVLHEIAHVLNTKNIGHTQEFHDIFDDLRLRASKIGVFNPSIPVIQNYSGEEKS